MKIKQTKRGFDYIEFSDLYKQECSLQLSSLATQDAIWFGVDNTGSEITGANGKRNCDNNRMHLSRKQVGELLPYLIGFYLNGCIKKSRYIKLPKLVS